MLGNVQMLAYIMYLIKRGSKGARSLFAAVYEREREGHGDVTVREPVYLLVYLLQGRPDRIT